LRNFDFLLNNTNKCSLLTKNLIFGGKLGDLLLGVLIKFVLLIVVEAVTVLFFSTRWLQKLINSLLGSQFKQVAVPFTRSIFNFFIIVVLNNVILNGNDFNELILQVLLIDGFLSCWIKFTFENAAEILFKLFNFHDSVLLDILISEHLAEVIHL